MNHRRGLDRHQTLLLPERLEDYIAVDNPVRFLDAFVGSLDLRALGFAHAVVQNTGSPPYDPADLLGLYLYGYLHRVRSSRLLEAECHRNIEVLWLLGKLAPDHKTIADFRKDNRRALAGVARQFTVLCRKLALFGGQLAGIDGTKLSGVNSKDANFNEKKFKELIPAADVTHEENDLQQLANMAQQAKENLGVEQLEVVADQGYYSNAEVSACLEANITPYVAKAESSANTQQGLFGKSKFSYD